MPQNTVTIAGNLTDDPEMRFTPAGAPVARFNVAYSERYRDNSTGEWKDGETSFFTVYAWNALGEHVAETFLRGNRVIVTGVLRQRSYVTQDGEKRYVTEIRADDVGASVRFATARIQRVSRTRPGPADASDDPWDTASPERPAAEPGSEPGPEPAADGPQEPAEPPAEPGTDNPAPAGKRSTYARTERGRKRAAEREPAQ